MEHTIEIMGDSEVSRKLGPVDDSGGFKDLGSWTEEVLEGWKRLVWEGIFPEEEGHDFLDYGLVFGGNVGEEGIWKEDVSIVMEGLMKG
jgi:hypothetical protein